MAFFFKRSAPASGFVNPAARSTAPQSGRRPEGQDRPRADAVARPEPRSWSGGFVNPYARGGAPEPAQPAPAPAEAPRATARIAARVVGGFVNPYARSVA